MIRADHEISNEEERSYHDQLQPVRTILAVAGRLPPPSLEAQTSGSTKWGGGTGTRGKYPVRILFIYFGKISQGSRLTFNSQVKAR